jgi:hypothetical protein
MRLNCTPWVAGYTLNGRLQDSDQLFKTANVACFDLILR